MTNKELLKIIHDSAHETSSIQNQCKLILRKKDKGVLTDEEFIMRISKIGVATRKISDLFDLIYKLSKDEK